MTEPPRPQPDQERRRAGATDGRPGDRRQADRRKNDRRRSAGRDEDESWFGALGVARDSRGEGESFFDPGWLAAGDTPPDGRLTSREARRIVAAQDNALVRVYRTYAAARAVVGVLLVAAQGAGSLLGARPLLASVLLCIAYAVQAITLWMLPRYRPLAAPQAKVQRRRVQWLATIGVDLLAFTSLHVIEAGSTFNFAALLVLPVLMAGVLTSRLLSLATAAAVTIMLLVVAWRGATGGSGDAAALMLQSGLAGLGLFVITLLSGELAGRLAREELAARGSMELARQQAQLNRLVIEEMVDGVLVVDKRLRVRAANPAARALLVDQGLSPVAPFPVNARPAWSDLAQAVERALLDGTWPEAGSDVTLFFDAGHTRTLRVRVRFMRQRALDDDAPGGEEFCVLLLEDVRTAQARLRQEKLAAMGRVSAGIAHEIRNPLAAIAQANALMLEDELAPTQQRLARMVADNVERLKRIVDDVMEVAPGATPVPRIIDATAEIGGVASEWAQTVGVALGSSSRLKVELPAEPVGVVFDPEHLRRVLVNLLDNARRHASEDPGAIHLRMAVRDDASVGVSVISDGPPIPPEVERYLFEPFFSTRSRGTGLGLYICRELCERYGAEMDFRPRPGAERLRNEFHVTLRRGTLTPSTPPPLHLHS